MTIKNKIITFFIFIFFVSFLFGQFRINRLNREGVYVIGTIKSTSTGRQGTLVECSFEFKGVIYSMKFNPGPPFDCRIGRKLYIKVLPNDVSICDFTDIDVPSCVLAMEKKIWKKIPSCKN